MKRVVLIICTFTLLLSSISVNAYNDEANFMKSIGIVEGYEDGDFRLENEVSRAEFIKMVIMASKFKDNLFSGESESYFPDVDSKHWAYPYIEAGVKNNLISGYNDGEFKPDNTVKYEEALAIVLRLIDYSYKECDMSWEEQQIEAANEVGFTREIDCSIGQSLTRENVIKLLKNLLLYKNNNGKSYIESIGYKAIENTKIITQDKNGYTLTSNGIYKTNAVLTEDRIGTTGCLVLDNETVVGFMQDKIDEVQVATEIVEEKYSGPYVVKNSKWKQDFDGNIDEAIISKNGKSCSIEEIEINDVLYYASEVNKLQVYNNKITGIYQVATPNTDSPEKITVSGKEYTIDSVYAYSKLYNSGEFEIGDSITLLFGKDGGIVDVIAADKTNNELVGYVVDVGAKNFTVDGITTKHYFVGIQFANGEKFEYITKILYSNFKNRVVKLKFEDKYAKLNGVNGKYENEGVFDLGNKIFGEEKLSSDIKILDVYSPYKEDISLCTIIKPERIDQVSISDSKILYCHKNSIGEIDELILHNVTGDMIKYGLCVKANKDFENMKAQYTYDISGTLYNLSTSNVIYALEKGVPAMFVTSDGKNIETMRSLTYIRDSLKTIDKSSATIGDKVYPISDNVYVYLRNYYGTYLTMTIDELVENADKYNINAYFDKGSKYGGCIRIIVVSEK